MGAFSYSVKVEGMEHLSSFLKAAPEKATKGMAKGLYRSALVMIANGEPLVPVGGPPTSPEDKTPGALKASATVLLPEIEGSHVTVELGYGGAASAYALRQHEDLTYRHKPGQTAKFLERPMLEDVPNVLGRIADGIQEEM